MKIRKATIEDCKNIYDWRNHETNRQFSHNTTIIPYENHVEWYNNIINSPSNWLLIGELDNKPIGVVRFDSIHSELRISIYLVPDNHGKGYGKQLLKAAIEWLNEDDNIQCRGDYQYVIAEILPENIASIKTFEVCGFKKGYSHWYLNIEETFDDYINFPDREWTASQRRHLGRSLYVIKDIKKGEVFTEENIRNIRPGWGLSPKYIDEVLGKKATQDLERGTSMRKEYY